MIVDYRFNSMRLEPEQLNLLRELAEAANDVPRDKRIFTFVPTLGALLLEGPVERELSEQEQHDLDDLVQAGYLRIRRQGTHGVFNFAVTAEAHEHLAQEAAIEPLRKLEDEVITRYIEEETFKERHPTAYAKWTEAARLLWGLNPDIELTTIGHKTREAVQEFATELVESDELSGIDSNPAHTVARLKAVIDHHRDQLGEARRDLLDALVSYWGEVIDLLQRQEHGGQKEGEPLSWEDGRRAVFQAAIVMYEIDRTL